MGRKQVNDFIFRIIPFFIILLVVLLFFWKFFFKGLIPIPADITVGMYYPWLDYKWGYSVGVPVKNPLISDVVSQIFPLRIYAMSLIKSGVLPLWNPLMFAGYPLLANIQTGIFNPTNVLYFIFSSSTAWGLQTFLQPFFASLFTYLLLRSLRLGKTASIFGGLVFAFSGFNIIWAEWNTHSYAVAFLPLLLYLSQRYFLKKNEWFLGPMISLSLCLQIFSGYPQVTIYSILVLIFFISFNHGITKNTLHFSFWLLAGVLMSAIQLVPTIELFLNSQRKFEVLYPSNYSFPWRYLTAFVAPDFFGNPTTGNYWGNGDYTDNVGFTGMVSFVISIYFVIFQKKKTKESTYFIYQFIVIFLLLLCGRVPIFIKFLQQIGLGAMTPTRILFLINLSLAILGSFALDEFIKNGLKVKQIFSLVIIQAVGIWSLLIGSLIIYLNFSSKNVYIGIRNLFYPCLYSTVLIILLFMFLFAKKIIRSLTGMLIVVLAVFELFNFGWKFLPFIQKELIFPSTPVIEYLKNQKGLFRVEGGEAVPMNMLLPYGLESYSAYDPMYPLPIAQYMSLVDGGTLTNPKSRYGQVHKFDSPLYDLVNSCYILALKKDINSKPDQKGKIPSLFEAKKFKVVFEDKTTAVIKNLFCYPRAFLTNDFSEKSNNEIEISLNGKISYGAVVWEKYTPLSKELKITTKNEALLFISDSFYPGWKAFVDDKETKILKANYSFQSVKIPKGEHKIVFIYKPFSFFVGFTVSVLSTIMILFFLFLRPFLGKIATFKKEKVVI